MSTMEMITRTKRWWQPQSSRRQAVCITTHAQLMIRYEVKKTNKRIMYQTLQSGQNVTTVLFLQHDKKQFGILFLHIMKMTFSAISVNIWSLKLHS